MCRDGQGVAKDERQAVRLFLKAAEQGNVDAQFNVGAMYFSGRGVPIDDQLGKIWLGKAAEQGDAGAQHLLNRFGQIESVRS